jgi:CRP-like cAMP-binding protein
MHVHHYRPTSEVASFRPTAPNPRRLQSSNMSRDPAAGDIFPSWLKDRRDFQDTLKEYNCIDSIDICTVCTKPASQRKPVELKALELWSRKCYFFKGIGKNTRAAICDRLRTKHFEEGDIIVQQGAEVENLYFIARGKAVNSGNGVHVEMGVFNLLGENELMRSKEAGSTIKAVTKLDCVYLTKHDFDILAFKNRLKERYSFKERLRSMKCFSELKASKLEQLCGSVSVVQYKANDVIFDVREPSSFLYYIAKGEVVVDLHITIQKVNNWPKGHKTWETLVTEEKYTRTIKLFKTGDLFGEREFVLNSLRETKAVAKSDRTVLYLFNKDDLDGILNSKEKEEFLNLNDRKLASPEVAKKLKSQIADYKLRFTALLEASDIRRVKQGRALWDESISRKKDNYAKELILRHNFNMKQILKDKKFSVSISPRRTVSQFYTSRD